MHKLYLSHKTVLTGCISNIGIHPWHRLYTDCMSVTDFTLNIRGHVKHGVATSRPFEC